MISKQNKGIQQQFNLIEVTSLEETSRHDSQYATRNHVYLIYRKKLGTVASAKRFLDFCGPTVSKRVSPSYIDTDNGGDVVEVKRDETKRR